VTSSVEAAPRTSRIQGSESFAPIWSARHRGGSRDEASRCREAWGDRSRSGDADRQSSRLCDLNVQITGGGAGSGRCGFKSADRSR
jgi:hypothetical protein